MSQRTVPAPARWAVLGATGQIGHFLCQRVAAGDAATLALSRRPPLAGSDASGIHWIGADLFRTMPAVEARCLISAGPLDGLAAWLEREPNALSCERLVAFSSTSASVKAESDDPQERALAARLAAAEGALAQWCEARAVAL